MEYVDFTQKPQRIISICTGLRGIERGLERAGIAIRPVVYLEIEAMLVANLVAGMEAGMVDTCPVWTDVKTFPAYRFYRKVHGLIGGYPCQPFSLAGLQTGEHHPAHLWPYIKTMAGAIRPVWCFFENVANHLNIGYQQVKADLEELGYTVKEGIYSAAEAGASHRRERLFILAVDHSIGEGLEGYPWDVNRTPGQTGKRQARSASQASFPMGQGYEQYEWEEPRTVKPGVGSTVNGYNFHTDILRALGNSVVAKCSEIAFIDLLNKHYGDMERNKKSL